MVIEYDYIHKFHKRTYRNFNVKLEETSNKIGDLCLLIQGVY